MMQYVCNLYKECYKRNRVHHSEQYSPNRAVFESMVLSLTRPNLLNVLLETFPKFLKLSRDCFAVMHMPDILCQILTTALQLKAFQPLAVLRCSLGKKFYLERTKYQSSTLYAIGKFSLKLAFKNDDVTILQILLDVVSFKSASLKKKQVSLFVSDFLNRCCLEDNVQVMKFLVDSGFDVYVFCEETFNDLYGFRSCSGVLDAWDYDERSDSKKKRYKTSAIYWSAHANKLNILKYLLHVVDQQELRDLELSSPVVAATMQYRAASLELLLKNGYLIDIQPPLLHSENVFLEYTLFHRYFPANKISRIKIPGRKDKSPDSLRVLLKWGALEMAFGKHSSTISVKKFLQNQWLYIAELFGNSSLRGGVRHPRTACIIRQDNVQLYVKKFSMFLQHVSLFKVTNGKNLDECVPSLTQLCRFVIRCCIVQKFKTLKPMQELKMPSSIKNYLFCVS